jgi:hypothetical protein
MRRSGITDLPLHGGKVPAWLYERMAKLGGAIVEVIVSEYGHAEFLRRLSDPFWFQSFGAVLGMDWHSSGITTSVMGALKKTLNQKSKSLGIYVCGGRGLQSRATPQELVKISAETGLDGDYLVRCSKLSAKVDNTALQDGFQLYLHNFVLTETGEWCVIQQGMHPQQAMARRYHWHSPSVSSFTCDPHTSVYGKNVGPILNLVAMQANGARQGVLDIVHENPAHMLAELPYLKMPNHHDIRVKDVDLKRLGAMLYQAHDTDVTDFADLLLLKGMGPRTLQSLALVSELIHGTPTRFADPARFAFAHGGKDGHPFPIPLTVYDETIDFLDKMVSKSALDRSEKVAASQSLHRISTAKEASFEPNPALFDAYVEHERKNAERYGGRTVFDDGKRGKPGASNSQLSLF